MDFGIFHELAIPKIPRFPPLDEPLLTREETLMDDINKHLRRSSWTIYNLDQLNLIQKHIKIISKIIDEDHHNVQRYSDEIELLYNLRIDMVKIIDNWLIV